MLSRHMGARLCKDRIGQGYRDRARIPERGATGLTGHMPAQRETKRLEISMIRRSLILCVVSILIVCPAARRCFAQESLAGPEKFPEFRNLSGLAGGGYGVDWRGYYALGGPTGL